MKENITINMNGHITAKLGYVFFATATRLAIARHYGSKLIRVRLFACVHVRVGFV